jgi:hypothetical protein
VSITRIELLVKQLITNAGKGNSKALGFLLEMEKKSQVKDRKQAFLAQGQTIHSGMSVKEAAAEWERYLAESRAVHRLFESEGFRFLGKYDSRCWLGWRPASDGPTSFQ